MSKYKKGFGLVEVLIALLLVSSTLILALNSVSRGLKISKENEIRDSASSILIRGLEFKHISLPTEVLAEVSRGYLFVKCYKLDSSLIDQADVSLVNVSSNCSYTEVIDDCYSQYKLANTEGVEICNQIQFTNVEYVNNVAIRLNSQVKIISTVVYYIDGLPIVETVIAYRNL